MTRLAMSAMLAAGLLGATGAQAATRPAATHPAATPAAAPVAKVSLTKARAIALRTAPGKVVKSDYQKEGGAWRYSFDIQQKGHVRAVAINAMTGRVVENRLEGKRNPT